MPAISIGILAGGQSRRFGTDKALFRLEAGGPTVLERVITACAGLTDDLFVVAPSGRGYGGIVARVVDERFPGEGPAGGLISALAAARHPHCLVLACDTPFLSRPLLRYLIEQILPDRSVVPQRPVSSRQGGRRTLEVLHAVYPNSVLTAAETAFAAGERQLAGVVTALHPRLIPLETLLRFDPGLLSFRSINRPDDVIWARRELLRRRGEG